MSEMPSPLKTIKAHCLDCSGGSHDEVKKCPCENHCKLWPYRTGKAINRAKRTLTDEQREILRQRMANARNVVK